MQTNNLWYLILQRRETILNHDMFPMSITVLVNVGITGTSPNCEASYVVSYVDRSMPVGYNFLIQVAHQACINQAVESFRLYQLQPRITVYK